MTRAPERPALRWLEAWPESCPSSGHAPPAHVEGWMWAGLARAVPPLPAPLLPTGAELADAERRPAHQRAAFHQRRLLLRRFAAALVGVPPAALAISAGPTGQPLLLPPWAGWHLSLSHRGDMLSLALGRAPVGIDIEPLQPAAEPAWAMLADTERAALHHLPPPARWGAFLQRWTAKEAYLKATGEGLGREPATVTVLPQGHTLGLRDRGAPVEAHAATRLVTLGGMPHRVSCVVLCPTPAIIKA